jgi:hypothetical protein
MAINKHLLFTGVADDLEITVPQQSFANGNYAFQVVSVLVLSPDYSSITPTALSCNIIIEDRSRHALYIERAELILGQFFLNEAAQGPVHFPSAWHDVNSPETKIKITLLNPLTKKPIRSPATFSILCHYKRTS